MRSSLSPARDRQLVKRGLKWTVASQAFDVVASFGAMLVLVRLLGPAEYGRAAVVVGILGLLNTFSAASFLAAALQLPDDAEPDWQLHWTFAFYVQSALFVICLVVAGGCWLIEQYRPIGPLLMLASVGLLLGWPNHFGATMVRRSLDLRRLRIVAGIGTVAKLGVTIAVAAWGGGAFALVLGANVITCLPFAADLLLVRGWRPEPGWWRWPDWRAYRSSATFGGQQIASGLIGGVAVALEAALLPGTIGYAALGLITRARSLYSTTFGRLTTAMLEAVYPFLPREAADPVRYSRRAGRLVHLVLLVAVPAASFLALEGVQLSRVLYGRRWIAMDPLIVPGALSALALTIISVCCLVLTGAGQLRATLVVEAAASVFAIPPLALAWQTSSPEVYCWSLMLAETTAACFGLVQCAPLLGRAWPMRVVAPSMLASAAALGVGLAAAQTVAAVPPGVHLTCVAVVFGVSLVAALWTLFPESLAEALDWIPGGRRLQPIVAPRLAAVARRGT
jgi:O-antigen/teichoic acid export membrane protein